MRRSLLLLLAVLVELPERNEALPRFDNFLSLSKRAESAKRETPKPAAAELNQDTSTLAPALADPVDGSNVLLHEQLADQLVALIQGNAREQLQAVLNLVGQKQDHSYKLQPPHSE